jgi:transcriptional regulator with XRE-family HTH domain
MNQLVSEIRQYMEREKLTQLDFVDRTKKVDPKGEGISQATLSRILSEKQSPSVEKADLIAKTIGRDIMEVVYMHLGRPFPIPPDVLLIAREVAKLSGEYRKIALGLLHTLEQTNLENKEL